MPPKTDHVMSAPLETCEEDREEQSFSVQVGTAGGTPETIQLHGKDWIELVKVKVFDALKILPANQILIFEEVEMRDDTLVAAYNVKQDSFILVLVVPLDYSPFHKS